MRKAVIVVAVISFLSTLVYSPVTAETGDDHYQLLLEELQQKIDDADKRMVAHPKFLDELRAMVEKYRLKIRTLFLSDDFSDGDFTSTPAWQVETGYFNIDRDNRLRSELNISAPVKATEGKPLSQEQEVLGMLLKGILGSGQNETTEAKPVTTKQKEASIKTKAPIEAAFEIDISFVSDSDWGSMEVVLLGGSPESPRYRLIYQAAASEIRPVEIVRDRGGRSYTIESAVRYPVLDDGKPHRLQWIRDLNGAMKVLVDGEEILQTVELYYREAFTGLALINKGGAYAWDSVRAMSPLPAQ